MPAPEGTVEISFTVEPNYAGWRLDKYLCEKIRRLSRTRVQEIIENDLICDKKLKASSLVQAGLTFKLRRKVMEEPGDIPPLEALREIYRDDALLVLDKPAGLPIHPTARYHDGTVVGHLKKLAGGEAEAWPAHRLDRETSGLLICGRTLAASQALGKAFVEGRVHKQYVGICEGHPAQDVFEVDAPIAEGTELIRIAVRIDAVEGKPARTRFEVERRFEKNGEKFALLRCFPLTGRQHQIRIHLHHAGFPLVGDKMYGPDPGYFDRFSKRSLEEEAWAKLRLKRHALHAAHVSFVHPVTKRQLELDAPLPEDLLAFMPAEP